MLNKVLITMLGILVLAGCDASSVLMVGPDLDENGDQDADGQNNGASSLFDDATLQRRDNAHPQPSSGRQDKVRASSHHYRIAMLSDGSHHLHQVLLVLIRPQVALVNQ